MSGAAMGRSRSRRRQEEAAQHFHLPSVHVRNGNGDGYDYNEDYLVESGEIAQVLRFAFVRGGVPAVEHITHAVLDEADISELAEVLPELMREGNPEAEVMMKARAADERDRQLRIAAGEEGRCFVCGCSDSRSCPGGCVWATRTLCSRCV